ncbi:MAG: hypothetical protein ACUVRZ_10375 [Desulfobacca sp.]|uniref:hypothetical protein n=1 Tax=Desulfobacca sp. TaxID=2067990 RepID=UPI00404B554B
MPVGLNLLFRLGRRLLAAPLEDSGLLPGKYYRSQALAALEEQDFAACLRYLRLAAPHRQAKTRMIAQVLILRCRLLQEKHRQQRQAIQELCRRESDGAKKARYVEVLREEEKAIQFLDRYIKTAQEVV